MRHCSGVGPRYDGGLPCAPRAFARLLLISSAMNSFETAFIASSERARNRSRSHFYSYTRTDLCMCCLGNPLRMCLDITHKKLIAFVCPTCLWLKGRQCRKCFGSSYEQRLNHETSAREVSRDFIWWPSREGADYAPVRTLWFTASGVHPGLRTDFRRDQSAQGRSWKTSYLDLRLRPHLSWFIFFSRSTHMIPVVRVFDSFLVVGGPAGITRSSSLASYDLLALSNVVFSVVLWNEKMCTASKRRRAQQTPPWLRNDLRHGTWSGTHLAARRYVQERDAKDCFG
ncbi:hypothetical protein BDR07DRAFT_262662 [Suillus spraguei]|nr:hypothetical protein BDR07DRAFT_262662 [Suillus spraguei]